jgi:hypothetical protein
MSFLMMVFAVLFLASIVTIVAYMIQRWRASGAGQNALSTPVMLQFKPASSPTVDPRWSMPPSHFPAVDEGIITVDTHPVTKSAAAQLRWDPIPFPLNEKDLIDGDNQQARIYKTRVYDTVCAVKVFMGGDGAFNTTLHERCQNLINRISANAPDGLKEAALPLAAYRVSAETLGLPPPKNGYYDALVYKWIEGKQLHDWLYANPSKARRKKVFDDVLDSFVHLEKNGVIHFDPYPVNIIVDNSGQAHLFDLEASGMLGHDGWLFRPAIGFRQNSALPPPPDIVPESEFGKPEFRWIGTAMLCYIDLAQLSPLFFLASSDEALKSFARLAQMDNGWPPQALDSLDKKYLTSAESPAILRDAVNSISALCCEEWMRILYFTFAAGITDRFKRPPFSVIRANIPRR